jgi:mazG domain protein
MTRQNFEPPRAVLCGSYTRDREGLFRAYDELVVTGCQVLSPRRIQFDDDPVFVRNAAEQGMSPLEIEKGHLLAICQADFVMIYAPDGYVGLSAAMEIGFATAQECPVFSRTAPQDIALRGLVKVVPSVYDALQAAHLR